jgi:hypothetical protein
MFEMCPKNFGCRPCHFCAVWDGKVVCCFENNKTQVVDDLDECPDQKRKRLKKEKRRSK